MTMVDCHIAAVVDRIQKYGEQRQDRTGVGTRSIFGDAMRLDLNDCFPIVTTKYTHFKSAAIEMLWMLRGEANTKWMTDQGVTIWDEWASENGDLGPVYGVQWRDWFSDGVSYDQIADALYSLKNNPHSRRHIINAWNVGEIPDMALPPCHYTMQFYVSNDNKLSCMFNMRSVDVFLGLPFNLTGYALLTHIFAKALGYGVGHLSWIGGDVHLYDNHKEQVEVWQKRPLFNTRSPQLEIVGDITVKDILDNKLTIDMFKLNNYEHDGKISAPVAV